MARHIIVRVDSATLVYRPTPLHHTPGLVCSAESSLTGRVRSASEGSEAGPARYKQHTFPHLYDYDFFPGHGRSVSSTVNSCWRLSCNTALSLSLSHLSFFRLPLSALFPPSFSPSSSSWSPRHKGSLNSLQATQAHATRQRTESLNGAARSEFVSIADGGAGKITPMNNAWDEPRSWQTSTKQSSTTLDALEFMSEQDASPQTSQNGATSPGTSKDKKGESRSGLERLQSLVPLQIITSVEEARDITVAEGKVTVLLAVIPKKLYAKPMFEILSRLVKNEIYFE